MAAACTREPGFTPVWANPEKHELAKAVPLASSMVMAIVKIARKMVFFISPLLFPASFLLLHILAR
jgi:hypothetical protein